MKIIHITALAFISAQETQKTALIFDITPSYEFAALSHLHCHINDDKYVNVKIILRQCQEFS